MARGRADVVVVGAGLLGLATARALADGGSDVVVLECGGVGNLRAGSKGSARIFRYGYDDPLYVRMAQRAAPLWERLEEETGTVLLEQTGQLSFGGDLGSLLAAMDSCGAPCSLLGGEEVTARWPPLRRQPAVLEPESGVLVADRCLAALAHRRGFELVENTEVTALVDEGDGVTVRLSDGAVSARVAVVCAGGRTGRLVQVDGMVPQRSTLEQVVYLRGEVAAPDGGLADLPILIGRSSLLFYSLPVRADALVKAGLHGTGPVSDPATAAMDEDAALVSQVFGRAAEMMPGAALEVAATERCLYDNSPNDDFVLDRFGNVVVGCGTSGHGFKFGPYLGQCLADLALGVPIADELARFKLR